MFCPVPVQRLSGKVLDMFHTHWISVHQFTCRSARSQPKFRLFCCFLYTKYPTAATMRSRLETDRLDTSPTDPSFFAPCLWTAGEKQVSGVLGRWWVKNRTGTSFTVNHDLFPDSHWKPFQPSAKSIYCGLNWFNVATRIVRVTTKWLESSDDAYSVSFSPSLSLSLLSV